MTKDSRIVITGFMAVGKTTVAGALADLLGSLMIDLDRELAERERRSIHAIIEENGEAFFREVETCALQDILENKLVRIIALGGGTWAIERNRALIAKQDCCTVWLDAPFELSWRRIMDAGGGDRPLARDYARTKKLYEERRSRYALAKFRIEAGAGRTAQAIAAEIAARCSEKQERDWSLYVNR